MYMGGAAPSARRSVGQGARSVGAPDSRPTRLPSAVRRGEGRRHGLVPRETHEDERPFLHFSIKYISSLKFRERGLFYEGVGPSNCWIQ